MVKNLSIGVLGIQGDVSEHVISMRNAFDKTKKANGEVFIVKYKEEIDDIDALIFPGGESSTISNILYKSGLFETIIDRIKDNSLPIIGTCAGCILLAKKIVGKTNDDLKLLNAMDIEVERNAFGRQKFSFERNININGFTKPYYAVFIRAPRIIKTSGNCEILAKIDKKIIMARQDKFLALSFHPELTRDTRIHEFFINMIV